METQSPQRDIRKGDWLGTHTRHRSCTPPPPTPAHVGLGSVGAECHIFMGLLGAPRPSSQGLPWDPHLLDPRYSPENLGFNRDWKREGK